MNCAKTATCCKEHISNGETHRKDMSTFDCIMICSVLALSLSKKAIKKLSNRHGLVPKQKTFDYAYGLYRLHQLSHETDGRVANVLTRTLNTQHARYIKQLDDIDATDITALESYVEEGMAVSPGGVLWSLLTEPRDMLQSQGVYYAHKLLYELFRTAAHGTESCGEDTTETSINHAMRKENTSLRAELRSVIRKLEKTHKKNAALETEQDRLKNIIAKLENRPNRENQLLRENKKLTYRLNELETSPQKQPQLHQSVKCPLETPEKECGMAPLPDETCCSQPEICPLKALKVAVIGGLDRLEMRYRNTVESLGGEFVFHSGHCQNGTHTLRNMVCNSDIVVIITSVNSHTAMWAVKAECKKSGKQFAVLKQTSPDALKRKLQAVAG